MWILNEFRKTLTNTGLFLETTRFAATSELKETVDPRHKILRSLHHKVHSLNSYGKIRIAKLSL